VALFRFPLRAVPNGGDDHAAGAHTVKDNIWRSANHQLANSRARAGSTEVWMISQCLDDSNNPQR